MVFEDPAKVMVPKMRDSFDPRWLSILTDLGELMLFGWGSSGLFWGEARMPVDDSKNDATHDTSADLSSEGHRQVVHHGDSLTVSKFNLLPFDSGRTPPELFGSLEISLPEVKGMRKRC